MLARAGFTEPERAHQAARLLLVSNDPAARSEAVALHKRLLVSNAASVYEWMTTAFAFREAGDHLRARYAAGRARQLGQAVAPAQMEAVHFFVADGNREEVLRTGRHVLELVPNYDGFLFRYYAQMGAATPDILNQGVPLTGRALASFLDYAMETRNTVQAEATWKVMTAGGLRSAKALAGYTSFLISEKLPLDAWSAWQEYYRDAVPADEANARIFNPGFEREPVDGPFDWHWTEVRGAQAELSSEQPWAGRQCLKLAFSGEENVAYSHLSQTIVAGPGRYELEAYVKAEGITTNQGVSVQLTDNGQPVASSEPLTGSSEWKKITSRFALSGPRLLVLRVVRQPSAKFDNKIAGTFRLDNVSLKRVE
ncbi:MAG: hypothetical protein NTY38_20105 [Acidobacteria bacterium]|nr:hypothetical protein [Acidobacteriota bacterium]